MSNDTQAYADWLEEQAFHRDRTVEPISPAEAARLSEAAEHAAIDAALDAEQAVWDAAWRAAIEAGDDYRAARRQALAVLCEFMDRRRAESSQPNPPSLADFPF